MRFAVRKAPTSGPVGTEGMFSLNASSTAITKGMGSRVVTISMAAVVSLTASDAKVVWSARDRVDRVTASSHSSTRMGDIEAMISLVRYVRHRLRVKAATGDTG